MLSRHGSQGKVGACDQDTDIIWHFSNAEQEVSMRQSVDSGVFVSIRVWGECISFMGQRGVAKWSNLGEKPPRDQANQSQKHVLACDLKSWELHRPSIKVWYLAEVLIFTATSSEPASQRWSGLDFMYVTYLCLSSFVILCEHSPDVRADLYVWIASTVLLSSSPMSFRSLLFDLCSKSPYLHFIKLSGKDLGLTSNSEV